MTYTPPTDPLLRFQYYIDSSALDGATIDINLGDIWADYTGAGVTVGIYDFAIQEDHPDLNDNYNEALESEEDVDTPPHERESHGTPVAGIIAAERNGEGTVGIAYGATIGGLRLYNEYSWLGEYRLVRAMEELTKYDVTNHSWTYSAEFIMAPGNPTYPGAAFRDAVTNAGAAGRNGLGTIIVTSAGNDRSSDSSPDMQPLASMRQSIVVAATDYRGLVSSYSEEGASVFVTAPSSATLTTGEVATTDLLGAPGYDSGDYTLHFGGTSASGPMIAAVAALMLEANADLGWRDVQDILALTARHTGSPIGGPLQGAERAPWIINSGEGANGGGYHFSRDYGFGLVDAHAAVRLAETWTLQQTSANELSQTVAVTSPTTRVWPDGISYTFEMAGGIAVENLALDIRVTTNQTQYIVIEVVSPSGTVEEIFSDYDAFSFGRWIFRANAFRGEESGGVWTVNIRSLRDVGATAQDLSFTLYGDPASDDNLHVYTDEFGRLTLPGSDVLQDESGIDTLNASALSEAAAISLAPGAQSSIAGRILTIAAATWIENAFGGDGDDRITGNILGNTLHGMRGNDTIEGGAGGDTLFGGRGNDTYANPDGDTIIELAGEGTDTVLSRTGFSLAGIVEVENLRLVGQAAVSATGNQLNNVLTGNDADNGLFGRAGNDTLVGGKGNDTLDGGGGSDTGSYVATTFGVTANLARAIGSEIGNDALVGIENLIGGAGNDRLTGDAGANVLDGRAGGDRLTGKRGDDIYLVDDANDVVIENRGEGTDLIRSGLSFSLAGTHVENLTLTGSAERGTGNGLANILVGNRGDNILDGRGGADTMRGGAGSDTYFVNDPGDMVVESNGPGVDSVISTVSFSLAGQQIENLSLSGSARIGGTGNGLANLIEGNGAANLLQGGNGNDTLDGGAGADTLAGGAGYDLFRFSAAGAGNDTIMDLDVIRDSFDLSGGVFTSLTEDGASTMLYYAGGRITANGLSGLSLEDWNELVLGGAQGSVMSVARHGFASTALDYMGMPLS